MSIHAVLLGVVGGVTAGGRDAVGLLLDVAFVALVLPLTATVSAWTHRSLGAAARRRARVLGPAFLAVAAAALVHGPVRPLLVVGGGGALAGGLYVLARARTGPRAVAAQLAAILGISVFAPLAWLLVAGPVRGWSLSAPACFLAFGGTVPYVRERVRRRGRRVAGVTERIRRGWSAILWQGTAVGLAALAVALHGADPLAAVAFLPGAVKTAVGISWPERRPPIRRIGYVETAAATIFAVLAGVGLGLAPR